MNSFDKKFFKKYVPEWQEILWIVHEHFLIIIDKILLNLFFGVLMPVFLYLESNLIQEYLQFEFLEGLLFIIFFKTIYDIFNRYNDVWIITNTWVVDLDWALFDTSNVSVKHDNIEWIEVEQKWILDTILWKWDLIIHKIWDDNFLLRDAISPFKAIDEIEKAQAENTWWIEIEEDNEEEKFDKMMNILSEMVDNHMDKKSEYQSQHSQDLKEKAENLKKKSSTIDLS